jgi:superfamily II DNA or RNA helicase
MQASARARRQSGRRKFLGSIVPVGANMPVFVAASQIGDWRLPLRAWQHEAFAAWSEERPPDALIVATPGAGKTRFAARVVHALFESREVTRAIVVVPREHLKAQVARVMAQSGIQLDHTFSNATRTLASDVHGAVVTYQQVASAPRLFREMVANAASVVVLDEIHHAGEEATWGQALRESFGKARFRVSMSGTPFRSDGAAIPFVRYSSGLSVADFSYDYAAALKDGVCRALVFPLHGGDAEWISRDGQEMHASFETILERRHESERLRTALTQPAWVGDVLEKAHLRLLSMRMSGHPDAGGLVAAMNQEHARFIAGLLERRVGVKPEIVVSDMDGASRRIGTFATSREPWIVAVHMISEGVDIPRLRVGVFASNVVTEMYFRQFCGRFVRTTSDRQDREAYVYVPDDHRIRRLAAEITVDVRSALRMRQDIDDPGALLSAANRAERASDEGAYASISAVATESHTLDFGPLFNPGAMFEEPVIPVPVRAAQHDSSAAESPDAPTNVERKERLRRDLSGLVARVSQQFGVDHKWVHATLNQRCGGSVATATLSELEARRRVAAGWLARRIYDGLKF